MGILVLFLILELQDFAIKYDVSCGLVTYVFYYVEVFLFFWWEFVEGFCHNWILNIVNVFSMSTDMNIIIFIILFLNVYHIDWFADVAAAKSPQSCPTLCDPIDGSPPGSPVPGILQARTLEWVAISFSNAWKWKVKVKPLSHVRLWATPWTAAYQAPPSMGFSRQEYWSGVPLPLNHPYISRVTPTWSWCIFSF